MIYQKVELSGEENRHAGKHAGSGYTDAGNETIRQKHCIIKKEGGFKDESKTISKTNLRKMQSY